MSIITKKDLIQTLIDNFNLTNKEAYDAISLIINDIKITLAEGGEVRLRGLGTLKLLEYKAKKGYDFKNKKQIEITSIKKPKFSPSKEFIDMCN